MKVMYFADSFRMGGKERQLLELLKGLTQRPGVEILLVCMDQGEFFEPEVKKLNVPLIYLFRKRRWDPWVFQGLLRAVRRFRPDVINTNGLVSSFYALPVAKLLGIPLVNGSIRNAFANACTRWRMERALLSLSDIRVANSEAGLLSRGFSTDSGKDFVIRNGIDLSRTGGLTEKNSAALTEECRNGHVVGMIAEFRQDKDYATYISAALQLLRSRQDVTFVAVGDGETLERTEKLVPANCNRIKFLGRRRDIENLICAFSVGVLATFTEGISNSVMEYMALGKPVVVTDGGGSRELVVDGEAGFLVPPRNPAALADKIAYLLDNPEIARRMGQAGRLRIERHFSLQSMVDLTLKVYELAKKGPAARYGRPSYDISG